MFTVGERNTIKRINSWQAYDILRLLYERPQSISDLADELDTSRQSINNYMRWMRDVGVVTTATESEGGRTQEYSVDFDGMVDFLYEYWSVEVNGETMNLIEFTRFYEDQHGITDRTPESTLRKTWKSIFKEYLDEHEEGRILRMIDHQYREIVEDVITEDPEEDSIGIIERFLYDGPEERRKGAQPFFDAWCRLFFLKIQNTDQANEYFPPPSEGQIQERKRRSG